MFHSGPRTKDGVASRQDSLHRLPEYPLTLADFSPLGFQAGDTNLHRYVGNNPTNLTDPSGLQPKEGEITEAFFQLNNIEKTKLLKDISESTRQLEPREIPIFLLYYQRNIDVGITPLYAYTILDEKLGAISSLGQRIAKQELARIQGTILGLADPLVLGNTQFMIEKYIEDLDSNDFATRESATVMLKKFGPLTADVTVHWSERSEGAGRALRCATIASCR
jgi:hypothetical protein